MAISVFAGFGAGSLFASNVPVALGGYPYGFGYGPANYWSGACAPWWSPYGFGGYGFGLPYQGFGPFSYYPWYFRRYGNGFLRYDWYRWRWSVGFGFGYRPFFGGFGYHRPYPIYRAYDYYPYSYYSTVSYYPVYSGVFHSRPAVVSYADSADPYVEFTDDVPTSVEAAPAPRIPEPFQTPFVLDYRGGGDRTELLADGTRRMQSADYLRAAEAFRLAWQLDPADGFPPRLIAVALLGAGGRYGEAGFALQEALDRDPAAIRTRAPLAALFPGEAALQGAMTELKRHVVRNPTDGEARFLLGASLLWSGDPFGARGEFQTLEDGGFESPHLRPMKTEADQRLLDG